MSYHFTNAFRIAWRYFFSPKSTHAVNILSIIAVLGISLVTTAMVVVLSVFNGFELFTTSQLSSLSPEYKLQRNDGQPFSPSAYGISEGVGVLETEAVARFEDNSTAIKLVGLGDGYSEIVPLQEYLFSGDFDLGTTEVPTAILGLGVAMPLGAGAGYVSPLEVMLPKRLGRISTINPLRSFQSGSYHITGIFSTDQAEDTEVVFVRLDEVRRLLQYDGDEVGYLALSAPIEVPEGFELLDRYQQHPDVYKILQIEKWFSFVLLLFVLLLSLFSVISTLGMLIIEKREDARTLMFLGARDRMINLIPLIEGWLLSATGLVIGLVVGSVLVWLQQQFGFAKLGGGDTSMFLIEAYPVDYRPLDLLLVSLVILVIGILSSLIAFRLFRWNKRG